MNSQRYSLVAQIMGWKRISGAWPESGCVPFAKVFADKALLRCPCDHLSPHHLDTHGWMDSSGRLSASGTWFHHLGWGFSTVLQIPTPFGAAGHGREEPPPAQRSGPDMYEPRLTPYHFRDRYLMPMMGEVHVSQSYCLCLSEKRWIVCFIFCNSCTITTA